MYAKLPSYSANFLGGRIDRVRVFWVGAAEAAGAASARLAAPTTRFTAGICAHKSYRH